MNWLKWILKDWLVLIMNFYSWYVHSGIQITLETWTVYLIVLSWTIGLIYSLKVLRWRGSSFIPFLECIFQSFICAFTNLKFTGGLYVTGRGSINEIWSQFESCYNWGNGAFVSITSYQSESLSLLNIEIETQIWNVFNKILRKLY